LFYILFEVKHFSAIFHINATLFQMSANTGHSVSKNTDYVVAGEKPEASFCFGNVVSATYK